MAQIIENIKNLELYIRAPLNNKNSGRLEGYAAGLRGDTESELSYRIPVAATASVGFLTAGDVLFISNAHTIGYDNSTWRTLRNGHVSLTPNAVIPAVMANSKASPAEEAAPVVDPWA